LSGVNVIVVSVSGAWLAGLAADLAGGFEVILVGIVTLQLLALAVLVWQRSAQAAARDPDLRRLVIAIDSDLRE